ncbi:MAG: AAA family ATPase, partial [Acidobacteriota bacterium]
GQLGESRLIAGMDADISGSHAHALALDADTKGPLRDIHRRVGTTVLFESSGGQVQKVAHLPELRFALGQPDLDTTSIDNAAFALEARAYYVRRHGSDGFVIHHKPTLKKVVSDRRASLDEEEVRATAQSIVRKEFERGALILPSFFPADSTAIPDSPRLTLVVLNPDVEWGANTELRSRIGQWTRHRGDSSRLYPAALVWCVKKPGRDLREKVELMLAWARVEQGITEGTLGVDFDRSEQAGVRSKVKDAEEAAKDEVWGGYRFVVLLDNEEPDGLRVIDLGAGHASAAESLCGRVIAALKSQGLLNESVSASYIDRKWPPALKESGAWPLPGLRQSFLDGSLTRLVDPDTVLRAKVVDFIGRGDFGLASGQRSDGTYSRVWLKESILPEDVAFEVDVFLLTKTRAEQLKGEMMPGKEPVPVGPVPGPAPGPEPSPELEPEPGPGPQTRILRLVGTVPPEVWNRIGTRVLPKLRSGADLKVGVDFTVTLDAGLARNVEAELRQALADLGLSDRVHIEDL